MTDLTRAEFEQWANSPITIKVRNYMLSHHEDMRDLSQSGMIENNTYSKDLTALEALGLEAAMRMSVVKGIELFTNFDDLESELFGEPENEQA